MIGHPDRALWRGDRMKAYRKKSFPLSKIRRFKRVNL
jgi:hypothetical protein